MRLRVGSLPIAFRSRFEHSAAARDEASNVVVIAADRAGNTGLGEGCPRPYVTGETVESALAALGRWRAALEAIESRAALERWIALHEAEIDSHPSAFAAVELALLDALARRAGQDLETFLGVRSPPLPLRTSAVYGVSGAATFLTRAVRYHLFGMRDAKLKLSCNNRADVRRARLLACFGRVRVDANNLWRTPTEARPALEDLAQHVWAVEEPLAARDYEGLAELGLATRLAVILDESATRIADLEELRPGPEYIVNVRVSKHGGLLRTVSLLRAAEKRGLRIIVGAQVGETSILARAGIVAARAAGSALLGFEGAFGTRLLARDATTVSVGFGYGGRLRLEGVGPLGSGLSATNELVAACT